MWSWSLLPACWEPFTWQGAGAVVALLLTLAFFKSRSHDLHLIPGPRGLPLLGSVLQFGSPKAHHYLIEWGRRWPIYKFRLLHYTNVVLTNPVDAPALVGRTRELPKAFSLIYEPSVEVGALLLLAVPACSPAAAVPSKPRWLTRPGACQQARSS
jgi:hypothetical protein